MTSQPELHLVVVFDGVFDFSSQKLTHSTTEELVLWRQFVIVNGIYALYTDAHCQLRLLLPGELWRALFKECLDPFLTLRQDFVEQRSPRVPAQPRLRPLLHWLDRVIERWLTS